MTPPIDSQFTLGELLADFMAIYLKDARTHDYSILLAANDVLPPSPWTDKFKIVIRHDTKTISIHTDVMT